MSEQQEQLKILQHFPFPCPPPTPFSSEPLGDKFLEGGGREGKAGWCGRSYGGGREAGVCVGPTFLLPKQRVRVKSPKGPVPHLHMPSSPRPQVLMTCRSPVYDSLPPALSVSGLSALRRGRMSGNPLLGVRKATFVESRVLSQLQ